MQELQNPCRFIFRGIYGDIRYKIHVSGFHFGVDCITKVICRYQNHRIECPPVDLFLEQLKSIAKALIAEARYTELGVPPRI